MPRVVWLADDVEIDANVAAVGAVARGLARCVAGAVLPDCRDQQILLAQACEHLRRATMARYRAARATTPILTTVQGTDFTQSRQATTG